MSDDFFQKAVDPQQYDSVEIDWSSEATTDSPFRRFVWHYLSEHIACVKGKRVIDIGSGTGWLLPKLVEAGALSVQGLEPSQKNVEVSKKVHPDIPVTIGGLDTIVSEGIFDVVFLIYVTTHLEDLTASLRSVYQQLSVGGILFVVTPDFEYALERRKQMDEQYEMVNDHVFVAETRRECGLMHDVYRDESLFLQAVQDSGFTLIENSSLFPTDDLVTHAPRYKPYQDVSISKLYLLQK